MVVSKLVGATATTALTVSPPSNGFDVRVRCSGLLAGSDYSSLKNLKVNVKIAVEDGVADQQNTRRLLVGNW